MDSLCFGLVGFSALQSSGGGHIAPQGNKGGPRLLYPGGSLPENPGQGGDISIGDNVSIFGDVDLRNREQGRITIEDGVVLDANCRLIAANEAELLLKSGCHIGPYCVFNCGTDVTVGANTLLAGFCYVQSSNHGIKKGRPIKKQPHNYGKIEIGEDSWLGSHVSVLAGSNIAQGTVVGSKAVVTGETEPYSIYAGVPARKISERPD